MHRLFIGAMEPSPQPEIPEDQKRQAEAQARRILEEFQQQARLQRDADSSERTRFLVRAFGIVFLLLLGLGGAWLLLQTAASLPPVAPPR